MQTIQNLRIVGRLSTGVMLGAFVLVFGACQPVVAPGAMGGGTIPPIAATVQPEPMLDVEPAQATINTRSLRVRQGPGESFEQIASVKESETYDVTGMSSDGAWVQLAIEEAPEGSGWVSTEMVTLEGDITNIPTVEAEGAAEAMTTPEATEEAMPEATEVPAEEMTPEATEEAMPEATEVPAEEMTPEATEEAMPEATEVPAEEMTPEATEEAPAEGAVTPPPAGYALVQAVPPLRVRSAPNAEEENKVGNVFDGEIYKVLEVSEDGQWVRIDVPELGLEDGGWVAAEFVVLGE